MDRASARRRPVRGMQRCLRYGEDEASERLARVLLGDPRSRYVPVGLLDDHPGHHRLRLEGLRVPGGREEIAEAVRGPGRGP